MSNKIKISEMPTASSLKNEDYIPIVQDGINKKIKVGLINSELEKLKKALFIK